MPLSDFQSEIATLLAANRSPECHLAGGAALHIEPRSLRFSNDLDYFNDSDVLVAKAFALDEESLLKHGYRLEIEMKQPGYIRAQVSKKSRSVALSTKVEWAHDSAWRFLPAIKDPKFGYLLSPIDLAINKVLTLAGRNEPRDFVDALYVHEKILSLGALCWAAVGKDPGFNPRSLLELLKRRGRFHAEDFSRLNMVQPIDLVQMKSIWLGALDGAEQFIAERPPGEVGALYYSKREKNFISPRSSDLLDRDYHLHFGRPGGVLPKISDSTP